jgi:drug/metabolite transporter (DMT)-like permease
MNRSPHVRTVALAFFVTFLWSTSWVLIKLGLKDIPALTFAGLRYTLAFLCLLPFAIRSGQVTTSRRLSFSAWLRLIVLGLLLYPVTQGAQFLSLFYLPAVTTSLLLSFTTIGVALLGLAWLNERPTWRQRGGTALYLVGVIVYFYPAQLPSGEVIGLIVAGVCVLGNALSTILGRHINRDGTLEPMTVTVVSMGIGSVILLASGIAVRGLPRACRPAPTRVRRCTPSLTWVFHAGNWASLTRRGNTCVQPWRKLSPWESRGVHARPSSSSELSPMSSASTRRPSTAWSKR